MQSPYAQGSHSFRSKRSPFGQGSHSSMRVCRLAVASGRDDRQRSPPLKAERSPTCHRVRMLLIFAFDAPTFWRRSPDFQSSLIPGIFFLPRFGLIEFSHSSRSRMILRHRHTPPRTESKATRTLRAPSGRCRVCADPIVPCCRCRVTRGG